MLNRFSRTELLLGEENMSKLAQSKIAIFGIGGVGSYVAEGLARCGIGEFILIDSDDISLTNINSQIHALETTIGHKKTLMMKERILAINPQAKVTTIEKLYTPESNFFNWDDNYTYIVDAVDDVKAKINLIVNANKQKFVITDIYKTHTCPLARIMRKTLKQQGIKKLKVLYSTEEPFTNYTVNFKENTSKDNSPASTRKQPLGSISFVPPIAGLMIAGEIVKDICQINR